MRLLTVRRSDHGSGFGCTGTGKRSSMQFSSGLIPLHTAGFMMDSYQTMSGARMSGAAAPGA